MVARRAVAEEAPLSQRRAGGLVAARLLQVASVIVLAVAAKATTGARTFVRALSVDTRATVLTRGHLQRTLVHVCLAMSTLVASAFTVTREAPHVRHTTSAVEARGVGRRLETVVYEFTTVIAPVAIHAHASVTPSFTLTGGTMQARCTLTEVTGTLAVGSLKAMLTLAPVSHLSNGFLSIAHSIVLTGSLVTRDDLPVSAVFAFKVVGAQATEVARFTLRAGGPILAWAVVLAAVQDALLTPLASVASRAVAPETSIQIDARCSLEAGVAHTLIHIQFTPFPLIGWWADTDIRLQRVLARPAVGALIGSTKNATCRRLVQTNKLKTVPGGGAVGSKMVRCEEWQEDTTKTHLLEAALKWNIAMAL